MPNVHIADVVRPEILAELAGYMNDDGLDHVADAEGLAIDDPAAAVNAGVPSPRRLAREGSGRGTRRSPWLRLRTPPLPLQTRIHDPSSGAPSRLFVGYPLPCGSVEAAVIFRDNARSTGDL